jgi:allantoinase
VLPCLYPSPARDKSSQYSEFVASRPSSFEFRAVDQLIALAESRPSPPIHVAHVSAAEVLPIIHNSQREGMNGSAETCFHYLFLTAEDVPERDTRFKAEPPIREAANKSKVWSHLLISRPWEKKMAHGTHPEKYISPLLQQPISMVVSDHSPCALADKLLPSYIPPHEEPPEYHDDVIKRANGDFFHAWGGISSLGLGLLILWTELSSSTVSNISTETRHRGTLNPSEASALLQLSDWLSADPARLVGVEHEKGQLAVGCDGDVLVFDPDVFWTMSAP